VAHSPVTRAPLPPGSANRRALPGVARTGALPASRRPSRPPGARSPTARYWAT